ncbi:hypothetical protein EDB81DRAFT_889039 [Dactylonectria macrodidyma]|uniref:Uncharacterized protein n=1 Tax=Dactylonectria macrodidyma TaxID=307937 RepID=A0A9P9E1Z4_9HYPO|nr:hypothetical protein EDB81DRAFT_889039 [Dactylonectria macrodidyma]
MPTHPPRQPPHAPRQNLGRGRGARPTSDFHNSNFIHQNYDAPLLVYSIAQIGGKGSFTHPRETTGRASIKSLFPRQPAQFQPRTNWSHWPDDGPSRLSIWDRDIIVDQKLRISKTAPSLAFRDRPVVEGQNWLNHQAKLWSIFAAIEKKKSFSVADPSPLLILIRSGLESQVGIMIKPLFLESTWRQTTRNPSHTQLGHNPMYHAGAELLVNPISDPHNIFGFENATAWKKEMFNRRFFIGFVANEYGTPSTLLGDYYNIGRQTLWSSIIWDRHRAHLYIYNAYSSGYRRDDLIIRIGLAFRQVLATNGMPFDFDVFAPPVTQLDTKDLWATGVVATNLLLINLRGLVSVKSEGLVRTQVPRILEVDGQTRIPKHHFTLRHRDWDTEPWDVGEDRVSAELVKACDVIRVMIMDELGIKDLTFDQGQYSPDLVSLTDRSTNMTYLPQSSTSLRTNTHDVYTNLGGPQYVVFDSRRVQPSRAMRLVHPPATLPTEYRPSLPHRRPPINFPRTLVPVPLNVALLYLRQGLLLCHDEVLMLPRGVRVELADCARRPGIAMPTPRVRGILLVCMYLHLIRDLIMSVQRDSVAQARNELTPQLMDTLLSPPVRQAVQAFMSQRAANARTRAAQGDDNAPTLNELIPQPENDVLPPRVRRAIQFCILLHTALQSADEGRAERP